MQRAMAAMAMGCRPDIIVLDEPTTALDVTTQIEVLAPLARPHPRIRHRRPLHHPRSRGRGPDRRTASWCCATARWSKSASRAQILEAPDARLMPRALVNERRAAEHIALPEPPKHVQAGPRDQGCRCRLRRRCRSSKDINLSIARGETVAVVGESGSGKSSLARVVVGLAAALEQAMSGFDGEPLPPRSRNAPRDELRRIQMIYQMPDVALNPRQTSAEIIGRPVGFYFGRPRGAVKERVAELLGQVGLPADFVHRRPGQLSGGQKQRVCIARALAAEPDLIICDEPTSALDPLVAEEILKLLRRLQDELGVAYLFITHDLGTVRRIAHRTAVMLKGEIVAQGPTADIFSPPFHPYTEKLHRLGAGDGHRLARRRARVTDPPMSSVLWRGAREASPPV